jgi:hypothetical protein
VVTKYYANVGFYTNHGKYNQFLEQKCYTGSCNSIVFFHKFRNFSRETNRFHITDTNTHIGIDNRHTSEYKLYLKFYNNITTYMLMVFTLLMLLGAWWFNNDPSYTNPQAIVAGRGKWSGSTIPWGINEIYREYRYWCIRHAYARTHSARTHLHILIIILLSNKGILAFWAILIPVVCLYVRPTLFISQDGVRIAAIVLFCFVNTVWEMRLFPNLLKKCEHNINWNCLLFPKLTKCEY